MSESTLDNLVWQAMSTDLAELAEVGPKGRGGRFRLSVSPFCGLADESAEAWSDLAAVLGTTDAGILMGPRVSKIPGAWQCLLEEVATQWVAEDVAPATDEVAFARLGPEDVPEMLDLTERTEPGPFLSETIRFGRYWGLREDGRLIAMAGERMRAGEYVEVSAVCVDPSAQRRGLGGLATRFVVDRIRERGATPMLHVREGNDPAMSLYEKLGFRKRCDRYVYLIAPPGWVHPAAEEGESE